MPGTGTWSSGKVTPFQALCCAEIESIFHELDIRFISELVEGKGEKYVIFHAGTVDPSQVRIYVYEDEAGFFLGQEWHIWERPDYLTADELMNSFICGIRNVFKAKSY